MKLLSFKISGQNFPSSGNKKRPTLKKLLIFQEMKLSCPKLKKNCYISRGNLQILKNKNFFSISSISG